MGEGLRWPSPDDTRPELTRLAPPGAWDSIFVLWPQADLATGAHVPTGGWGLAIRATPWSNDAHLCHGRERGRRRVGEAGRRRGLGCTNGSTGSATTSPGGLRDAGGRRRRRRPGRLHQAPHDGWTAYYHDLMTGRVTVGDRLTGIPAGAWRSGSIPVVPVVRVS